MTCKDCYHYDVCHIRINSIDFLPVIKGKISMSSIMYKECDDVEKHCSHFKDKSRIIELPCKFGDEAYYISVKGYSPLSYKLLKAKVIDLSINRNGIYAVELKTIKSDYKFTLDIRKVYFEKSEAEAKLKELNGND